MTAPNSKRWVLKPAITPDASQQLSNFHPIVAQLLFNRQVTNAQEAKNWLDNVLNQSVDPFLLTDMDIAVERIAGAIHNKEKITIYGDYDVDGVTSSALLWQVLTDYGVDCEVYIPNRFDEGYGLNIEALTEIYGTGTKLVITVDCGIRSIAEVSHGNTLGLDVIITDHHHPGEDLPPAHAVINPKRSGDLYPEKMLAGVAVAFKLARALADRLGAPPTVTKREMLELVALGTVADLAPLSGENRALVYWGVKMLNQSTRPGLKALLPAARLTMGKLRAGHIGYSIGPRLNAAGRMDSAKAAYELLVTTSPEKAKSLAWTLENHNLERQQTTEYVTEAARRAALDHGETNIMFAAHETFNSGVVGLAASRLQEEFYKPAFVAAVGETHTVGSARSIREFHVTDALDKCSDLLERYGGHAAAAGFTVANENVPAFRSRLNAIAAQELADQDIRPVIAVDMEIDLDMVTLELAAELDKFEPLGYGNPRPTFMSRNVNVMSSKTVGRDDSHLKMTVSSGDSAFLEAIAFRLGSRHHDLTPVIDVVYTVEADEWQGRRRVQLKVKDFRPALLSVSGVS